MRVSDFVWAEAGQVAAVDEADAQVGEGGAALVEVGAVKVF